MKVGTLRTSFFQIKPYLKQGATYAEQVEVEGALLLFLKYTVQNNLRESIVLFGSAIALSGDCGGFLW